MGNCSSVLQICSYYVTTQLYQNLFSALGKHDIIQDVYVFVDEQYDVEGKTPDNVYFSKCYRKCVRIVFGLKPRRVLSDIKTKIDVEKYGVLHAHSLFSNGYIAYKLYEEFDIPYVVAVRNTDVNLFFRRIVHLRPLGVKILRNAKKIIFISEPYKRHVIDQFVPEGLRNTIEAKSVVVPNGIDDFWLEEKFKSRRRPHQNEINILYVGVVNSNKNIETTIAACEMLISEGYEVKYQVIGAIKNRKYEDLLSRYSFVQYLPHCDKEELIRHYRNADIFVMPSKHETFGLVYAEAMSQGLPVIYTRGQGFDGQYIQGEVGYSVRYDSPLEIVLRVKDILGRYNSISTNCLRESSRYDWNRIAKIYADMYSKLM